MSACPVCGASSAPRIGSRCNVCPAWAVFAKKFNEDDYDINHRQDAWEGFVFGMEYGMHSVLTPHLRSAMNVTGLSLDEVTRLLRLAERDVETLQAAVRKADAYAKRLEAELEAVSPECPSCLQLRRDRGGDPRAPAGQHQDDCPEANMSGGWDDEGERRERSIMRSGSEP